VLALDEEGPAATEPNSTLRSRAREDVMVRRLAGHALAVIVLGGAHDLSASVRELAPGAEYIRVTTRAYHNAPR
jgi:hypothetical protein